MKPEEIINQKILLSALNWGMGHVARCIPLIHQLLQQENEIFIAGSKVQTTIFSNYFPQINYIEHTDYPFAFGENGKFSLDLLKNSFSLYNFYRNEQKKVAKWVKNREIDLVISDHRYGFFSKEVPSIFITHQLHLPLSCLEKPFQILHKRFLSHYNEVWVLDTENSTFAGDLSKPLKGLNLNYIGVKSRFSLYKKNEIKQIDQLVIVSGPLPYSVQFYHDMKQRFPNAVFIVPAYIEREETETKIFYSNDWKFCDQLILQANVIISRSGYSTIMDVSFLNIAYHLVPTPGQAEQLYLSRFHKKSLLEI
ncbi:MAG: hypothetical protein KA521_02620 [Crocinitomicaceae bacterium]|nr:hypothetical protein [Crocinitomicaceae bacterium]